MASAEPGGDTASAAADRASASGGTAGMASAEPGDVVGRPLGEMGPTVGRILLVGSEDCVDSSAVAEVEEVEGCCFPKS